MKKRKGVGRHFNRKDLKKKNHHKPKPTVLPKVSCLQVNWNVFICFSVICHQTGLFKLSCSIASTLPDFVSTPTLDLLDTLQGIVESTDGTGLAGTPFLFRQTPFHFLDHHHQISVRLAPFQLLTVNRG